MKTYILIFIQLLFSLSTIYSQDFWGRTSGLDSLTIFSLSVNSSGDIFAGADTSYGVFRSTDNGDNWTSGLDSLQITGIVIKPGGEILISTLDYLLGGGVFHSTDNGDNWTNMGYTGAATSVAINSVGDIFAGTFGNGIVRSTDNGTTWNVMNEGLPASSQISALAINLGDTVFVGAYNEGIYRSTDNGESWEKKGFTDAIPDTIILSLATNSNGEIFSGTEGSGLFRSSDNGNTWLPISQGLTSEGRYIRSLIVDLNGDIFAGTFDGVYRSVDNGDNWIKINEGLDVYPDVYSLAINSNGDVFAGTENGVFRSNPSANIKVFLQGPYAGGSMNTTLRDNGYIPLAQPYTAAPFNYNGAESVSSIPAGVVDWVLLELRSDLTTQVSRRAAFLLSDGSVVDLDGVSTVRFPGVISGDYYLVIRHRNHLAVMTANPITLSYSPGVYDFSDAQTEAYGTNAMKDLGGGSFGLIAGDIDGDGNVDYASDLLSYWLPYFGFNGYYVEDINLNGDVDYAEDLLVYWLPNFGFSTQVP